jgi:hypothetical protein
VSEELGLKYVHAIAEQNFELIQNLFTEGIIITVATPAKTWHAIGWLETEKVLREFFPQEENVSEVVSVNNYPMTGRSRISYVFRGHENNFGLFEYEHQAYYQIDGNMISHMRTLCSGLYKPKG